MTLGWRRFESWSNGQSWKDVTGSYLVLSEGKPGIADHLALSANSSSSVDEIWKQVENYGGTQLYADEFPYAGGPHHYAAYFRDPGGITFEIVAPSEPLAP